MQLTRSQQDALNIEKHVCVTAGAGSGKTTVLVDRYLEILRGKKVIPQKIVAITFTEKASAEMRARVVEKLNTEKDIGDREKFLEQMNTAPISTIHAFCSRILREFPFQADVPANFSVVSGIDQKLLLQRILRETLKDIATNQEHNYRGELTRLLKHYGGRQKLEELFSTMINQRDVIDHLIKDVYGNQCHTQLPDAWEQIIRAESMSEKDVAKFIQCLNTVSQRAKGKNATSVTPLIRKLEALPQKNPNSPEVLGILKKIAELITIQSGSIAKTNFLGRGVKTADIDTEVNFLVSAAEKIKTAPVVEADGKTDDHFLLNTTHDLLTLYKRISNAYQTAKLSQGKLDFNDLQLKTRDLLRSNEGIRQKLIDRYEYYMVDEYQDTNELQHELIMLLTNNLKDAKLFIVGDPKQSIYGFRGSDVRVFKKAEQKIRDEDGEAISLKENFRSLHSVIEFVNYFFNHLMGDGKESEFEVPYESLVKARKANIKGAVQILLGKQGDETANEYALIAQHIKNMRVEEKSGSVSGENGTESKHSIAYDDIAILIRSRRHLPDIEHALLEAGIPYLTTGGIGFYQRQEIYDIWNYLNFLDAPEKNQTSLVGILRAPAFGISDAELYEISLQNGTGFWDKAQTYQRSSDNLKNAIDTLKKHIEIAHRMSVNQLILTIVNETGMIGTLKTGKQGQQRWANYQKLLELARNFDGDENRQILPDFIEFLDILITEEPREGQAPVEAGTGSGAVQIMTIHAAKGLQFPVVILPCLDRGGQIDREPFIDEALGIGFSPLNPEKDYRKTEPRIVSYMKDRSREKEDAEKKRLFYVGATRARDRLILSGTLSGRGKPRQMLEWLHKHLNLSEESNLPRLPFELEVFSDNNRQLEDITAAGKTSNETTPVEFPGFIPSELEPIESPTAFSVSELANYARCPLRYQLENLLQIPPINGDTNSDESERDIAIRRVLARIRRQSDAENLDTIVKQVSENNLEIMTEPAKENFVTTLNTHVDNFINSGLGETAFDTSETYTNQQIHANINEHIIDGRFDRLFKDETGDWQVINYKTDGVQNLDTYHPEMELYSLLLHRRYPNQSTVTINLFFTQQSRCEQMHFSTAQLQEIQEQWQEKIWELQRGVYEKNLDHCCSCPYANLDGECLITEA